MKIKSLLIGSAALVTASTGSYAADAIVMAEPEPVEYVRVCDVYGAGFFYIPGTETCLRIGGYVRFQIGTTATAAAPSFGGYNTLARYAPNIDVRTETEWGTVRAFSEVEITYQSALRAAPGVPAGVTGYGTDVNLAHAVIDIVGQNGMFRIGKSWSPYSTWLGGGGTMTDGNYNLRTSNQLTYFFNASPVAASNAYATGPGFSAFISLADDLNKGAAPNSWSTDLEAGIGYGWGANWVRAAVGYDNRNTVVAPALPVASAWGAKFGGRFDLGSGFDVYLAALYSSRPDLNTNFNLGTAGAGSSWSILGAANYRFSPKAQLNLTAQWFNRVAGITAPTSVNWTVALGANLTPVSGLQIRPEITYATTHAGVGTWGGIVRFQRSF